MPLSLLAGPTTSDSTAEAIRTGLLGRQLCGGQLPAAVLSSGSNCSQVDASLTFPSMRKVGV